MNQVTIEINDTTNNVIGKLEVFTHDDFPLTLNYVIADISNLTKRSGAFTKTFRLPANKSNNQLFSNIYNVNIQTTNTKWFEKKPCTIKVNDLPVIRGFLTLKNVISKKNSREYECTVSGNNLQWVELLSELYLDDMDFGLELNPSFPINYSRANIEAGWPSSFTTFDYVFPVIHYGEWNSASSKGLTVTDLRPALYIISIIRKSFDAIGWRFSSNFMGTTDFKKLIMPWFGGKWQRPPEFVETNRCSHKRQSWPPWGQKIFTNLGQVSLSLQTSVFDPLLQINGLGRFQPDVSGHYKYQCNFDFNWSTSPPASPCFSFYVQLRRVVMGTGGVLYQQKFSYKADGKYYFESPYQFMDSAEEYGLWFAPGSCGWEQPHIYLIASHLTSGIQYNQVDIIPSTHLGENSQFTLKSILPKGVNMLKFLQGIIHAFNLYATTDFGTKIVHLEPRSEFYDLPSNARDFTNKLDIGSDVELKFISDYEREYCLDYTQDKEDKHLQKRNEAYGNIAGRYCHTFSDRFKVGKKVSENPFFSYTYHIFDLAITVPNSTSNKQDAPIIARLWNEFRQDSNPPPKQYDFEPRLLYYDYSTQINPETLVAKTWHWYGAQEVSIPTGLSQGFEDIPSNWCLSYSGHPPTGTKGLFELYYSEQFAVIEKGTLLKCYVNLTVKDITVLDFRKLIYFDEPFDIKGYWILNKIEDYAPTKNGLTKIELVRFEDIVPGVINNDNLVLAGKPYWWYGDVEGNVHGEIQYDNYESVGIGKGKWDFSPNVDPPPIGGWNTWDIGGGGGGGNKNEAPKGTGTMVFGTGLIGYGIFQMVLGTFNVRNDDDIFQIGGGANNDDRENMLSINTEGNLKVRGGEVYAEVNGEITQVVAEIDGQYQKTYLKGN